MDFFYAWPLTKQYLAAHFYLSEEKPISISEAQRAQLGALHLFVSFGKFSQDLTIPDLSLCSQAERKKRIDEWKKLSILSKATAMQKFLDLITSLFPNWIRSRKLLYEFQLEWNSLQGIEQSFETDQDKSKKRESKILSHESNFSKFRRSVGKSLISSYDFSKLESEKNFVKKQEKVNKVKKSRFARTQSIDIQNSMYSFKEITFEQESNNNPIISDSIKTYKGSLGDRNSLKHFIEDLQSHKGNNIRQTSATKFPTISKKIQVPPLVDPDPPINFDNELKQFRRSLLQKEFSRYKHSEPISLGNEFDKLHDKISSLKLSLQQFPN